MCVCVIFRAHAYIYEADFERVCVRSRWEGMGRGWISVVLPDVIKTGAYTNNFMGICCLQSSAPSALKLQRESRAYLIFSSECSPGETAILFPKP